jgi:hypothetical protein
MSIPSVDRAALVGVSPPGSVVGLIPFLLVLVVIGARVDRASTVAEPVQHPAKYIVSLIMACGQMLVMINSGMDLGRRHGRTRERCCRR